MNFYRSGYESRIAEDLRERDIPFDFETETFEYFSTVRGGVCLACGGKKCGKSRKYTPDFVLRNGDKVVYVEAKGRFPSTDRSKMRDVRKAHPDMDVRMLFQPRSVKQRTGIANWCDKFGFKYEFSNTIPQEWIP